MVDWKLLGEIGGVTTNLLSIYFLGRGSRAGMIFGIVGVVPWTIFSVLTGSWFMTAQNITIGAINAWNLRRSFKKA